MKMKKEYFKFYQKKLNFEIYKFTAPEKKILFSLLII